MLHALRALNMKKSGDTDFRMVLAVQSSPVKARPHSGIHVVLRSCDEWQRWAHAMAGAKKNGGEGSFTGTVGSCRRKSSTIISAARQWKVVRRVIRPWKKQRITLIASWLMLRSNPCISVGARLYLETKKSQLPRLEFLAAELVIHLCMCL